ncbi:MAG TPA: hypothetical protein VH301_13225 [Usitatibacter sp.]|jgi:hypothetical protein|nr:hypothetical protein [Usitatibacter sp.]
MRPRIALVHDQECLAVPEEALVRSAPAPVAEPEPESRMPGSSRRDWVYREMALLGPDAGPWAERDH